MSKASSNHIGIFYKLVNLFIFSVISILFSLVVNPNSLQVYFLTSVVAAVVIAPFALKNSFKFPSFYSLRIYSLRSLLNLIAKICWIECLRRVALNEATAISYLTPIFTSFFAMVICKEKLELRIFLALIISFLGAWIIIKPYSIGMLNSGAVIAILAATMWALYDIICKLQTATEDKYQQTFITFSIASIMSMPFTLFYWEPISFSDFQLIFAAGILSAFNVTVLFQAYKFAPLTLLMPFSYARLIFMAIFTYFLFGAVLTFSTVIGVLLITLSSLFTLRTYNHVSHITAKTLTSNNI